MSAGKHLRVLVVGDSDDDFTDLVGHLRAANYWVAAARVDVSEALATALGERWDVVITGWTMPSLSGLDTLRMIATRQLDLPCIVFAPPPGELAIVAAIHAGAVDFVPQAHPEQIVAAIERAFAKVTERRARLANERELRLSEARHRAGFEVAPEALLTYDYAQARIVEANPAAVALFGYSVDELRAMKVGELSSPMQGDVPVAEASAAVIGRARDAAGRVEPYEWTFRSKVGVDLPCEARMVRLPTAGLDIARISIVDLRPRRRLEELRARAAELETQNRRIQEANRLKSEFLANMSHELRTPLNAIIGFGELLYDGQVAAGSPQHQEFLGDILSSGRHLLQLINDVLDLAKVEAGKLDLRPERCEPGKLAREVVALQRTAAAAKRLRVDVEVDGAVGTVHIDPSRFKQIVYNFVSNAIKFTPDGGEVWVRVVVEPGSGGDRFRLDVRDTGSGIAADDMVRLFVEFQQLESGAAKRHQGTGLGLALTKRLVEAQGGSVGVASEVGRGSTFHAILPRHVPDGMGKLKPAVAAASLPPRTGAPVVLVVEDDEQDRGVLERALAVAGFEVESAGTGAEAIARCAARDFDAITLDMLLPDVTGVDFLAALRVEGRTRDVPVVVITIVPAHETRRVVAAYAVHDVIDKPIDPAQLLASLARAGVRPDRRGGVLVVDDDPSALRLMDAALAQRGLPSITRSSAASALEAAQTLAPTAVVIDLVMPGMDGIEFLDHLRRIPEHASTPVVVWTMKDLSADERERLDRSAQGVVAKGDSALGVVHQLQALLGES